MDPFWIPMWCGWGSEQPQSHLSFVQFGVAYSHNTTNLFAHLQTHHKTQYIALKGTSTATSSKQETLVSTVAWLQPLSPSIYCYIAIKIDQYIDMVKHNIVPALVYILIVTFEVSYHWTFAKGGLTHTLSYMYEYLIHLWIMCVSPTRKFSAWYNVLNVVMKLKCLT